jgi:hypothetical protein
MKFPRNRSRRPEMAKGLRNPYGLDGPKPVVGIIREYDRSNRTEAIKVRLGTIERGNRLAYLRDYIFSQRIKPTDHKDSFTLQAHANWGEQETAIEGLRQFIRSDMRDQIKWAQIGGFSLHVCLNPSADRDWQRGGERSQSFYARLENFYHEIYPEFEQCLVVPSGQSIADYLK